jgi:solute carrier family 25 uncoupling protein 8/9
MDEAKEFATRLSIGAGAACIAEVCTLPVDTAKVRLQIDTSKAGVRRPSLFGTMKTIGKEEGVSALYRGMAPALQRQMVFAGLRLTLFGPIQRLVSGKAPGSRDITLFDRIASGLTAGLVAITIANPTEVVKVRMQAARRGGDSYAGVGAAYRSILATEGLAGLWRGYSTNAARNSVICAVELGTFSQAKSELLNYGLPDNSLTTIVSATIAGFAATVVGSPLDVVKTRLMSTKSGSGGGYTGPFDCARGTL